MDLKQRNLLVYGLVFAAWLVVVAWQIEEHYRVQEVARTGLINRSNDIADTVSAFISGLQISGAVFRIRLEPVLNELVSATNEFDKPAEVLWIAVLNPAGEPLASAGTPTIDPKTRAVPENGLWEPGRVTRLYTVTGARLRPEGDTNAGPMVVLTNTPRDGFRSRRPRWDGPRPEGPDHRPDGPGPGPEPRRPEPPDGTNAGPPHGPDGWPPRRPFWARGWDEQRYQDVIKSQELHGLALAMSTGRFEVIRRDDLWLRFIISLFAGLSALGVGLAWRNLAKTSELQIRLVRASQLNTHLREMNLAAAGLAHETRNPLNIIRGLAQMISKQPASPPEIRAKSREIVDETDKVTAQLNEFINYSRPRELRRIILPVQSILAEVVRALSYDLQEKNIRLELEGEPLAIEADEQMLRQLLFNLVLNAIQAVPDGGEIRVACHRNNAGEASLEVRDNGPGVPPEQRAEIFKPYFTTQQKGTGLGLAIVQQIVLAHGWEVECLANEPRGARFRVTHLKAPAKP